jgi:hypothetical protein
MTESDWQPLPTPMWPTAAAWSDAGDFMLLVFTQDGVPTWEVHGGATAAIWAPPEPPTHSRRPRRLRCSQHPRRRQHEWLYHADGLRLGFCAGLTRSG